MPRDLITTKFGGLGEHLANVMWTQLQPKLDGWAHNSKGMERIESASSAGLKSAQPAGQKVELENSHRLMLSSWEVLILVIIGALAGWMCHDILAPMAESPRPSMPPVTASAELRIREDLSAQLSQLSWASEALRTGRCYVLDEKVYWRVPHKGMQKVTIKSSSGETVELMVLPLRD